MKKLITSSALSIVSTILLFISQPHVLHAVELPATGTVEGRVFNAVSGSALSNARVTIDDTNREAITDATGSFRFTNVPEGPVSVSVSYIGMDRSSQSFNVHAGEVALQDFHLSRQGASRTGGTGDTVELDRYTVVAESIMSAQELSINEQRHSPNIKNVVAFDEFGDRGDENLGEFLTFLPGVSVNVAGDSGPSAISVRGLPPQATTVLFDGGDVASARGNTRAVDPHDITMANVSRIEVTKVPTPDLPASGLGGTVNLIPRSGFESKGPSFSYKLYAPLNSSNGLRLDTKSRGQVPENSPGNIEPSFALNYIHPITRSFAVSANLSRTWRLKSHDDSSRDEIPTWNNVDGFQRLSTWQAPIQLYKSRAAQIGFEWRPSQDSMLTVNFQQRRFSMLVTRSQLVVNYGAGATGDAFHTQGAATGVGSVTQGSTTSGWYEHDTATDQLAVKYSYNGDRWKVNASASLSNAEYSRGDIDKGYFFTAPSTITNLIIRGDDIPDSGGIPTSYSAFSRTGAPVNIYDGSNYTINTVTSSPIVADTTKIGGRFDVAREFYGDVPFTLKAGIAVDEMDRDRRTFARTWNFRPNGATDAASRLAGNFDVFDEQLIAVAPTMFGVTLRDISLSKLYQLFQSNPDWFALNEPLAHQNDVLNSVDFKEAVSAAYLRADLRLLRNRLWVVGGVRFERTDAQGTGPVNNINAQYQRDQNGNFIRNSAGQRVLITTDPLALAKLRYQERASKAKRRYSDLYPSLSLTYNLSEHIVLRGAYARTIGRPNINEIVPGVSISDDEAINPTINVNNTGLEPWTADNFDLSLESYNLKGGVGSIGVFRKNISDFFGTFSTPVTPEILLQYGLDNDGSYENYSLVTKENAGDARISGVEFSYRQSLLFLPAWADGFQVFLNATEMKLEGGPAADFTGFNPSSYSAGINYVQPRFFVKLTYSYQGETRRGAVGVSAANGIAADTYNYQGARTRWGINTEYSFHRRLSAYLSITDIGGFSLLDRQYSPTTPEYARGSRIQELGYYTTIGVKGTF